MMNYELAKKLKDAGFSQIGGDKYIDEETVWDEGMQSEYETPRTPSRITWVKSPTLSELIEACGDSLTHLGRLDRKWIAYSEPAIACEYANPEEAVANLWLALNQK